MCSVAHPATCGLLCWGHQWEQVRGWGWVSFDKHIFAQKNVVCSRGLLAWPWSEAHNLVPAGSNPAPGTSNLSCMGGGTRCFLRGWVVQGLVPALRVSLLLASSFLLMFFLRLIL